MSKNNQSINKETIQANIDVHAALAKTGEYNKSPHFRPENQDKVETIIKQLAYNAPNPEKTKLLDLGCGTGFILHLAAKHITDVYGIDVTEAMMAQVDTTQKNIHLKTAYAEETGFPDNDFDIVTAYSFLDHLYDYKIVLEEAYRVLKPGGVFYSDLNPNAEFSRSMLKVEKNSTSNKPLPMEVSREIKGMLHNGEHYFELFGINEETLTKAEPQKSFNHGFDASEVENVAKRIGFREIKIEYDWFLGQGVLMNSQSTLNINDIDTYLKQVLPASSSFFKYLRFVFTK